MLHWLFHKWPAATIEVAIFIVMVGLVILLPSAYVRVVADKPESLLTAARITIGVVGLNSFAILTCLIYIRRAQMIERVEPRMSDGQAASQRGS